MQSKWWWIFGGVLVWYYTRKIQAANALMVRYMLPNSIRIDRGAVKWNQPVVITNPTGTPINLQRFYMTVLVEGYPIGTVFGALPVVLAAGGETTIVPDVIAPIDALISNIPSLLKAGNTLDVRFSGNIFAEFLTIPVNTTIKVPIPKLPI